jgi:cytidylate kinase
MPHSIKLIDNIRPILGAVRSVPVPVKAIGETPPVGPQPFLTISRQPGAGAWLLAKHLVDALNQALPAEQAWTCWERELVEKVAADLHLSATLIDRLEDESHSWFSELLGSLSFSDEVSHADEAKVYARVARTIRALAQTGRVVIVGRGGVFVTRKMPGGIHIRLVAPFDKRVEFMVQEYHLTHDQAVARVKQLEHNRQTFYHRYWSNETLSPETFAITLNTAVVRMESMVRMLTELVKSVTAAGVVASGER